MRKTILHLIFLLAVLAHTLAAAPFSRIYSYGDSLSDPRPDPRFNNGPVAVEYLAGKLGIAPANEFHFAVAGATTGVGNFLDLAELGVGSVTDPSPRGGMLTQL